MEAKSEPEKTELVAQYFEELFGDKNAEKELPEWIYATFALRDLAGMWQIDGYFVKEILITMGKGKSCAEEDLIVVEMLLHLPEEIFDLVAALFLDRLLN